jgi:hypothetical protein
MRLLHTKERRFQEFFDVDIPKYAILSHRWGPDEVSYQDFSTGAKKNGAGYKKVLECCAFAANDIQMYNALGDRQYLMTMRGNYWPGDLDWVWVEGGLEWIWVDTCCIDKTSSAELSEAINSMYQWYARSEVCYAYLSDVARGLGVKIERSQWFTRGWTLQELLAPRDVVFLDKDWQGLGHRNDAQTRIARITGIPQLYLDGLQHSLRGEVSAAEKFSWAAQRNTSRKEDQAYCLLGLFDVSMPLLYGEGDRALRRLQRKIIKSSSDESIFLWDLQWPSNAYHGLLAESIANFGFPSHPQDRRFNKKEFSKVRGLARPPYLVTNQGLQFHVPKELARKQEILLPLNCQHFSGDVLKGAYAIRLEKINEEGKWARIFSQDWSDWLPQLNGTVHRLSRSSDLFIVPAKWIWSREDLSKRGSEVIYVMVDRYES